MASKLDLDAAAGGAKTGAIVGLTEAVQLLIDQEEQGVAADRTQDLFMHAIMADSKLYDAVLDYFQGQKDASPNTETYTSLIYVCVKMRRLDEGFKHFERMMNEGILPDCRAYAHLIKGCGRTKQIKRGEAFFRLLKQRNAPQVYDRRVYNAMINMYAHSKMKGQHLTPSEAAPPWEVFGEMQMRGIEADEITYNSLISLCGRTLKPDVARALSTLREMEAVGIAPTDVTLCALTQSLGRANNIELARREVQTFLQQHADIVPSTSTWRPLLHATAVTGDVATTQALYDEMLRVTGSHLFDSFKHRVSHAHNYLLLAHGYAHGYAAAETLFEQARERGHVDALSYSFMLELALGVKARLGRGPSHAISEEGRKLAIGLWTSMHADGITPPAQYCHKMFHVCAQEGDLEAAEALFERMRAASAAMQQSGEDLAHRWVSGDLQAVRDFLSTSPLSAQSMCHTSLSYVRLIEAAVLATRTDRAAVHLESLQQEAVRKDIRLGHELTTPLLNAFARGGEPELDLGLALHAQSAEGGRPCAGPPSLRLCASLTKHKRGEDAARVLLQMAMPAVHQSWIYSNLQQRVAKLQDLADALPAGEAPRASLDELLLQVRTRDRKSVV